MSQQIPSHVLESVRQQITELFTEVCTEADLATCWLEGPGIRVFFVVAAGDDAEAIGPFIEGLPGFEKLHESKPIPRPQ